MKYTEKEVAKLIEEVEKEFNSHLAKAEEDHASKLAKSEDKPSEEPKEEKEPKEEPKEEAKEEPKAESKEAPKEEPKEEPKHDEEGHDYDDEDMEHMHKMYMSMKKGEMKAHHDALRKCMDHSGMAKCGDMSEESPGHVPGKEAEASKAQSLDKNEGNGGEISKNPPHNSPGPKSEASDAEGAKMNKSEAAVELELLKSEVEAQKTKNEELKKSLDAMVESLTRFVKKSAPQGKAITEIAAIAKSEEGEKEEVTLSKSEITERLDKKARDASTTRADREAINAYYLDDASLKSISHLLR